MEYEKHKVILPQFETFEEVLHYITREVAIYVYQGGEWDKTEIGEDGELTLKEPLTMEQFMCELKHSFPHGFRVGDKYLDKWGHKIDKDDK
jgi:hypothetical protein